MYESYSMSGSQGLEMRGLGVAGFGNCRVWESWCVGVMELVGFGVGWLPCGQVMVWGSCCIEVFQYGGSSVGERWCV